PLLRLVIHPVSGVPWRRAARAALAVAGLALPVGAGFRDAIGAVLHVAEPSAIPDRIRVFAEITFGFAATAGLVAFAIVLLTAWRATAARSSAAR
ncbi:MAG TPA: hypothetical protein VE172_12395, partial [Stackebrandtia sp.]|uniref:hypothetical protein n=1 Tax=Stackebrandtia sp. TaxID=2023065 RepID=UPI002D222510